jgi:predicted DNA-binding transcriptional regulator AlpA
MKSRGEAVADTTETVTLIGFSEAARRLGVSWPTLRKWSKEGNTVPEPIRLGRRLFFTVADIDGLIESSREHVQAAADES